LYRNDIHIFSFTTLAAHRAAHPPPKGKGRIGAECAGYACGRGAAWVSWDCGSQTAGSSAQATKKKKTTNTTHAPPLDEASIVALLDAEGSLAGLNKTETKALVKSRSLGLTGASKCSVLTSIGSVQVSQEYEYVVLLDARGGEGSVVSL